MGRISRNVEKAFPDGEFFDGTDKFRGVVILWRFIRPKTEFSLQIA
jgi:hypothetical protein